MSWVLATLGAGIATVILSGIVMTLCKKYCGGWKWALRNLWCICQEWYQQISWLWASREEKVVLVCAQQSPEQTPPGIYGDGEHAESDIRLGEHGRYTRFEPVDRDVHPPAATGTIPPQPLRPAPAPGYVPTRTIEAFNMNQPGPCPLTPPPQHIKPRARPSHMENGLTSTDRPVFQFDSEAVRSPVETIELRPYMPQEEMGASMSYEFCQSGRRLTRDYFDRSAIIQTSRVRYGVHGAPLGNREPFDEEEESYGSYVIQTRHEVPSRIRPDQAGVSNHAFVMGPPPNSPQQPVVDPMYSNGRLPDIHQSVHNLNYGAVQSANNYNESHCIDMGPPEQPQQAVDAGYYYGNQQNFQNVPVYSQNVPNFPVYDAATEYWYQNDMNVAPEASAAPMYLPDPSAPTSYSNGVPKKSRLTTGERIFSALRRMPAESYPDDAAIFNSLMATPPEENHFCFTSPSSSMDVETPNSRTEEIIFMENGSDESPEQFLCASDLYSPKLNMEAQRTAREVCHSLQAPPPTPTVPRPEEAGPSTSGEASPQDILHRLEEQSRRSLEKPDVIPEFENNNDPPKRRHSHQFFFAMEQLQSERRSSKITEHTLATIEEEPYYPPIEPAEQFFDPPILNRALNFTPITPNAAFPFNNFEEFPRVCCICLGMEHDKWFNDGKQEDVLTISILQVIDLVDFDGQTRANAFARICMLSNREAYYRTRLSEGTPSPSVQNKFSIIIPGDVSERTLFVQVYLQDPHLGETLVGEAKALLCANPRTQSTMWLDVRSWAALLPELGDIIFSLYYMETTGKLTLFIVQCTNLISIRQPTSEYYIQVYLADNGKEFQKNCTAVKESDGNPVFKETIHFHVDPTIIEALYLRLTVTEISDRQHGAQVYALGHVIVGPASIKESIIEQQLFLKGVARPIFMHRYLRK